LLHRHQIYIQPLQLLRNFQQLAKAPSQPIQRLNTNGGDLAPADFPHHFVESGTALFRPALALVTEHSVFPSTAFNKLRQFSKLRLCGLILSGHPQVDRNRSFAIATPP